MKDLEEQLFVGKAFNDFAGIARGTVLVVENFEQALEWIPDEQKLHKVKYPKIHEFINGVINAGLKVVLVSRFKTKFNVMHIRFIQKIELKGIDTQFFWELYQRKNFDEVDFAMLCERFDSHTGLLALAYQESEWLYENELLRAVHNPTSTSKALWEIITRITQKLKKEEQYVLSALTIWQKPKTQQDIENALQPLGVGKLDTFLFSLRQKLLVQESRTANGLQYDLNPYLAEVYYAFMEDDKNLHTNFLQVKNLPAFQQLSLPAHYDLIQAHKQGDFPTFYRIIHQRRKAKQFDALIESLQKVFFEDSRPETILNEIGITYKQAGKTEESKKAFERAIKLGHISAMNELAIIFKEEKNLPKAKEILEKALEIEPNNVKVLNELAIIYKEEKNLSKAKEILEKALEIAPKDVKTLNELGIVYKTEGNLPKAKEILEKAIKLGHIPAMNELAIIYKTEGNLPKAKEILEQAIKLGNIPAMNELGIIYKTEGNLPKAKEILEKAMELGNLHSYNELAKIYLEDKNYENALKTVERGLKIAPKDTYLLATQKTILKAQKEKEQPKTSPTAGKTTEATSEEMRVLFLWATPIGTSKLNIPEECNATRTALQNTNIKVHERANVNKDEFMNETIDKKPAILHFSGHGRLGQGLVIQNEAKNGIDVLTAFQIETLFKDFTEEFPIQAVIFNACYSQEQAEVIKEYVPCVIGTMEKIKDEHAIAFSKGFYAQLARNPHDIQLAYKRGKTRAITEGADEADFVLFENENEG